MRLPQRPIGRFGQGVGQRAPPEGAPVGDPGRPALPPAPAPAPTPRRAPGPTRGPLEYGCAGVGGTGTVGGMTPSIAGLDTAGAGTGAVAAGAVPVVAAVTALAAPPGATLPPDPRCKASGKTSVSTPKRSTAASALTSARVIPPICPPRTTVSVFPVCTSRSNAALVVGLRSVPTSTNCPRFMALGALADGSTAIRRLD